VFNNPVLGGGNTLIRTSIHSPDYVAGVSGWTINKDGSAEFNDVDIRGTFTVVGTEDRYISLDILGGVPIIALHPGQPVPANGHTYYRGSIFTVKNPGASNMTYLELEGPQVDLDGTGKIVITGTLTDGTPPDIYLGPSSYGSGPISIRLEGNVEVVNGSLDVSGVIKNTGLGFINKVGNQDFTNTTVLADVTGMSFTAEAGAVYKIECRFAIGGPTAADVRLAWSVPAGAIMARNILAAAAGVADNASTSMVNIRRGAATQQIGGTSGGVTNDFTGWWEDTILTMDVTGGTVKLQGAQGTANVTPTRFQGDSYMIVTRIA
jgi:hypothetical protein